MITRSCLWHSRGLSSARFRAQGVDTGHRMIKDFQIPEPGTLHPRSRTLMLWRSPRPLIRAFWVWVFCCLGLMVIPSSWGARNRFMSCWHEFLESLSMLRHARSMPMFIVTCNAQQQYRNMQLAAQIATGGKSRRRTPTCSCEGSTRRYALPTWRSPDASGTCT